MCQLVALTPDQLKNLHTQHHMKYKGDEAITCAPCMRTLGAHIKGEAADLAIATEGHEKSPTECLQAFWRVGCNINTMNKNGNLGRKAAKLTVQDIKAAEEALSRASTAPVSRASTRPGTPTYNPGEGEDEAQEGGSSSAAMDDTRLDEDADDMLVDAELKEKRGRGEPKKKRGRGRPKGSKNKMDPKIKARYVKAIRGMKVVPRNQLEFIASIPDGQIRLVYLWFGV